MLLGYGSVAAVKVRGSCIPFPVKKNKKIFNKNNFCKSVIIDCFTIIIIIIIIIIWVCVWFALVAPVLYWIVGADVSHSAGEVTYQKGSPLPFHLEEERGSNSHTYLIPSFRLVIETKRTVVRNHSFHIFFCIFSVFFFFVFSLSSLSFAIVSSRAFSSFFFLILNDSSPASLFNFCFFQSTSNTPSHLLLLNLSLSLYIYVRIGVYTACTNHLYLYCPFRSSFARTVGPPTVLPPSPLEARPFSTSTYPNIEREKQKPKKSKKN
eukprot:gene813-454_t